MRQAIFYWIYSITEANFKSQTLFACCKGTCPLQALRGKRKRKIEVHFVRVGKKRVSQNLTPISADCKSSVKETYKGSWFAQQSQWPDELEAKSAESPICASKKKLESSKQAFRNESAALITENDSEFELSCASDSSDLEAEDKNAYDSDFPFIQPSGNYIANPENIQELLSNSAVCKVCIVTARYKSLK